MSIKRSNKKICEILKKNTQFHGVVMVKLEVETTNSLFCMRLENHCNTTKRNSQMGNFLQNNLRIRKHERKQRVGIPKLKQPGQRENDKHFTLKTSKRHMGSKKSAFVDNTEG
jgi:hypothetical protein